MIPITLAEEPADFDVRVRRPGSEFLDSLVNFNSVDFRGKEYWRRSIPDLRKSYSDICCYTCHWISSDTGASSADHFIPRKEDPALAYEWSNLRYCCSRLNSRKWTKRIIDPFEVLDIMFELIFPSLHISPTEEYKDDVLIKDTIKTLRLNDEIVVSSREAYVEEFAARHIDIDYLGRRAPLIAREILRQGYSREDLIEMGFGG